jgi:hypothetical protein
MGHETELCDMGMDRIDGNGGEEWRRVLYSVDIVLYCVFTLLNFCGRALQTSPYAFIY